MPDLTHKSVGALTSRASAGASNVAQPALAAGDYAVLYVYDTGRTSFSAPTGYTDGDYFSDGSTGGWFLYYRRATGTIGATNVSVTWLGGGHAKIFVMSGSTAGIGAPSFIDPENYLTGVGYYQSRAFTLTDRLVYHVGWMFTARTIGSMSNQGTITSTNASLGAYETLNTTQRLHAASSVVTSSSGGSVRHSFTGGTSDSVTVSFIIPQNVVAVPTGLDVSAASGALNGTHNAVSGADSYQIRFRQTGLTAPGATTQTSAPGAIGRMDDATPGADTTYVYTWNGAGVRAYVIDSGVLNTHNELTGRVASGFSINGTSPFTDTANHGTAVASALAGTTYGVAKGVTIVPINVSGDLPPFGDSVQVASLTAVVDWILDDLESSGQPGVVNISVSLLGLQEGGTNSPGTQTQLARLLDAGVPVSISSGNSNRDVASDVAEDDDRIVWAGASTTSDARDGDSNYGPPNLIFAPSGGMTAASNASNSATQAFGYTSGAAPLIAGVMAKNKQANPDLSPARIQEIIFTQARPDLITSVPTGPNDLISSDAIVTDWTIHELGTSTAWALDGLGYGTSWEVQIRAVDGGVPSDWSTSDTATTGLLRVTKTQGLAWNVGSRVAKTQVTTWIVDARIAGATSTAWNVAARLADTASVAWNVSARVAKSTASTWMVSARMSATVVTTWIVAGRVSKTSSTAWAVLERLTDSQTTTWGVLTRVAAQQPLGWNTLARAAKVLDVQWNTLSTAERGVKPAGIAWVVAERVAGSLGSEWAVLTRVLDVQPTGWTVLERESLARAVSWALLARAVSTWDTGWMLQGRVSRSRATAWHVLSDGTAHPPVTAYRQLTLDVPTRVLELSVPQRTLEWSD